MCRAAFSFDVAVQKAERCNGLCAGIGVLYVYGDRSPCGIRLYCQKLCALFVGGILDIYGARQEENGEYKLLVAAMEVI